MNFLQCLRSFAQCIRRYALAFLPVLVAGAVLPSFADGVVMSASGAWFAVDARTIKDTTWEGGAIVGGETNLLLQSSANAWGEIGGGTFATITWENSSGSSGIVASATTSDSVLWTPEMKFGTNTLTYVSGSVVKSARILVTMIESEMTLEEVLGVDSHVKVTTGGASGWMPVNNKNAKDGSVCARSGLKSGEDNCESWIQLTVNGRGALAFWCKTSCEHDDDNTFTWDRLEINVDGEEQVDWRMDGVSEWVQRTVLFNTDGEHDVKAVYIKDGSDYNGEDCAWIDCVLWTPNAPPADSLPNLGVTPTAAEVATIVADAADPKVAAWIDTSNYNGFRDWAGKVKTSNGSEAGADGVMSAQHAWLSYALGQDVLLNTAPADDDLSVETFEPTAEGKFDFTVSLGTIQVGTAAVSENLKKVFGLEGAETLDRAAFSSDKVDIEFDTPVDGKVKFTAVPKNASSGAFFMKVKLLP